MAAFQAAIVGGFGIECDVRASRDGTAFVFHDADLRRMTGTAGLVADREAAALDAMRLPDGGAPPRLAALLDLCGEATPLLVEIKAEGRRVERVCAAVARDLAGRSGAQVAVMSFNPWAARWFARQRSGRPRGLVVTQRGNRGWRGGLERALALWIARPDFIACDIRDLPTPISRSARAKGTPVLTWTVRSAADRARAGDHADQIIFEGPA